MLTRIFTRKIASSSDMADLEGVIARHMGGEKCSFVRSQGFIRLRLLALYKDPVAFTVYCEGLKVVLAPDRTVDVFAMDPIIEAAESELGKRPCSDEED